MKYIKRTICFLMISVLFLHSFPVCASADEDEEIMYGTGFVITTKLRLYSYASSDADVLDTAYGGDRVVIIRKSSTDGWFRVNYNLQIGYMLADCLEVATEDQVELGYGEINEPIVYLRSGPGAEYSILSSGFRGKEYYILGLHDGWYKILDDDETCYVRSDLLDLTEIPYENRDSDNDPQFFRRGEPIAELTYTESEQVMMASPGSRYVPISGGALLNEAKKYIGVPYVFGGTTPDGFDCSGLVFYSLSQLGYSSYRTAADQYNMGTKVSRSNLSPGDLVFFANTYTSGISHVGIYAGNGTFLHAPNDGSSVCYSSLSGYWSDHYHGARRLG